MYAYLGNACRVADDRRQADSHFLNARKLVRYSVVREPAVLARIDELEGTLRKDQRRFAEAEEMLGRALMLYGMSGGRPGEMGLFPNGTINTLSNMTHEFSYYLFNIGVAYKEDTDHVIEVLRQVADELMQDEKYKPLILAPLEVLGVDQFGDSAVVIKARFKTVPIQQWTVGREMNRRIKKKFDEVGIEIPFPHRSIYWGEASKPFAIRSEQDREELKTLIRDVLAERRPHEQAEDAQRKHPENA